MLTDAAAELTVMLREEGAPDSGDETKDTTTNWTGADEPSHEGVYLSQLKELSTLKDVAITGQIKTVFDLKSYVHPKTGEPGLIYRIVLEDDTGDVTVISFDDMAKKLKEYTVGQYIRITNAWKMEKNKNGVYELHVGNFAKIEVVE
jgi:aspartyl/asparaginyl-tRNA synthetase